MKSEARRSTRLATLGWASFALLACGSNTPKIPPELLATGGCASPNYPNGPFGTEEGDTLADEQRADGAGGVAQDRSRRMRPRGLDEKQRGEPAVTGRD